RGLGVPGDHRGDERVDHRSIMPCPAARRGSAAAHAAGRSVASEGVAMSTVMHPVGPRPAKVYWVRRLVVLLVLAVVVVLAWNLTASARGGGDPPVDGAADDAVTE